MIGPVRNAHIAGVHAGTSHSYGAKPQSPLRDLAAGLTMTAGSIIDAPVTAPSRPVTAPEWPVTADGLARYGYVVIEGPVGVGKSALTKVLAERWAMTPVFEQPQHNPFLERFYRDPARHAFAAQQHFLLERRRLAGELMAATALAGTPAAAPLVADFLPQKDTIYAQLNLDADEFALYERIAHQLPPVQRAPDLVIYLQATPESLFARIQKRATGAELQISDAYLRALCEAYNQFFYHYADAPLLTVNAENLAAADDEADLQLLLDHIHGMRGPREFFVKGSP